MNKEVIEKIAEVIHEEVCGNCPGSGEYCGGCGVEFESIAEAILNLLKENGWAEPVLVGNREQLLLIDEEKLACSLISKYSFDEVKDVIDETCEHQLDKALTARRICPNCGGSGWLYAQDDEEEGKTLTTKMECYTCKGTGGEKLLAVLAENQDLPFAPYYVDERIFLKIMEFLTTPKDGYAFRRVAV